MSRTLVIGDIHGGLKALHQLLERANVSQEDHLIFLGDYVDGWSEAPQTIDFLIQLEKTHHCTFIRGNHDQLCYDWLAHGKDNPTWLYHGGQVTADAYAAYGKEERTTHLSFYESLENYHLDEKNRLYLHAGFTNVKGITHEYFSKMFYWDRTLWEMVLSLDPNLSPGDLNYPKRLTHYHEIYIGHTPVTRIGATVPVHRANVWNIDTGAAFMGPLSLMDVDTKEVWQSDPVHLLYPEEQGRNQR